MVVVSVSCKWSVSAKIKNRHTRAGGYPLPRRDKIVIPRPDRGTQVLPIVLFVLCAFYAHNLGSGVKPRNDIFLFFPTLTTYNLH